MSDRTPEPVQTLVKNHRQFRAFLEQRVANPADAEEILQAAFLKTVEKSDTIHDEQNVVAWFYRVLRNAVVDHYRRQGAENRMLARTGFGRDIGEVEPSVERAICRCILDLLPTLPGDYATLLRRVDLENASITQVAADLELTPNNVRVRLHRARATLRRRLELTCRTCTEHGCLDCTCQRLPDPADPGRPAGQA
jgi:RNA polymerase sigma-70 factor (ECF subfamily)